MSEDFDFDSLESEFRDVSLPEHRKPMYPVAPLPCELENCKYNGFPARFTLMGIALLETHDTIAAGIATLRAHGDEILADQLEAPYEDMLMAYHRIGAAYGYWSEEFEDEDDGLQ